VFKEALQSSARRPSGWNSDADGAGILDALALLDARVPARAPARGARVASRAAAPDPWARIESFFPQADAAAVRGALLAAFAPAARRRFDHARRIEPLLDEIVFHVATDPRLRAAIAARLQDARTARGPGVRGARGVRRAGRVSFSGASATLRRALAN
jgi:hypothetical protein